MFKEPDLFWKNFRLGSELQVSGTFIYNGLYVLNEMEHFYYEDQCFDFLYNISVGLERLFKIVIILIEHQSDTPQENFEQTLITHNHIDLFNRIKLNTNINVGKPHIKFLNLLSDFYRSMRYNRYNLSSVYSKDKEQNVLITFLSEELNMTINAELMDATPNENRIKKFIGNIIGKLTTQLYEII